MKYLITLPALCLALALLNLCHIAKVRALGHPVDTEIAGMRLRTNVDSTLARDVLLRRATEGVAAIRGFDCRSNADLPTLTRLARVTRRHSVDTATALLVHCLSGIPEVSQTQARFLAELDRWRGASPEQAAYIAERTDRYTVLFVPGWGHLSNGAVTGSDLRRPRQIVRAMGFDTHLVPLVDYGTVEGNARTVSATVRQHLGAGKRVLVVSASSGGPAVALALGEADIAGHPALAGWLNICGVLRGSPVVDRFLTWPQSLLPRALALLEGWRFDEFESLGRARSAARFARFKAPAQLTILNYIGIPFSGQVSANGRRLYDLLQDNGPNDSLTYITDALAPGYTVMALGSDHFIREDPEIDAKSAALVPLLLQLIERRPALNTAANRGAAHGPPRPCC